MPSRIESSATSRDPLVVHSLQEARWIVAIWLICFAWVIGYCSQFGYREDGQAVATIYGLPSWVFWGVGLPWIVATLASSWFALFRIADDPLTPGGSTPGGSTAGGTVPTDDDASADPREWQSNDG